MNDDREPQPGDGPDFHADHAYWAARRVSPVTRPDIQELIDASEKWLGGRWVPDWIVREMIPILESVPGGVSPVTREALAGVLERIRAWQGMAAPSATVDEMEKLKPIINDFSRLLESLSVSPPAEVEYRAWFSAPAEWREIDKRHAREFQARGFPVEHRVKAGPWVPVTPGEGKE